MPQNSVYSQLRWKGYGIHEGFKKPSAPSRSYSAMIDACKSAESTLKAASAYYREFEEQSKAHEDDEHAYKERFVVFVMPLVILDGILLAASLSDTGQISIEEIQFAPVQFYYKSKHCEKGIYLVDIVTLKGLEEYVRMSERRHQSIFDEVEYLARRAT